MALNNTSFIQLNFKNLKLSLQKEIFIYMYSFFTVISI